MKMSEKLKPVLNQAVVCVNDKKYLDELVEHYSNKCKKVETFSYKDDFMLITLNSPVNYTELRKDVPYDKAKYITPVYKEGNAWGFLKAEISVTFEKEVSETELTNFLQRTGLLLKRKGVCTYLLEVPQADGEKTLEVVEKIKKEKGVESAAPNQGRITKSPDVNRNLGETK